MDAVHHCVGRAGHLGQLGACPAPGLHGNWGGSQVVVPADTAHPDEAFALARYLTKPESQLKLFNQSGRLPSAVGLHDREEILGLVDEFFGAQAVGQLYIDSVEGLPGQPVGRDQQDVHDHMLLTFFDIADGKIAAEDAWALALDAVEEIAASPE